MGSPQVVSIMLAVFIVGVSFGSLFCAWLSKGIVEPGIVPIGAFGLTLFCIDIFFAITPSNALTLLTVTEFTDNGGNLRDPLPIHQ